MRKLVPFKSVNIETWACSECAWMFKSSGPLRGNTIDEMKQNFARQRGEEFAAHICANHPKTKSAGR
jgi:hypothetical protein